MARSGGSYERGPSSMVRGGKPVTVARRGRSSKYGNNASHGTRLEVFHGSQDQPKTKLARFAKGPVWQPTSVALAQQPLTPPNGVSAAPTSTAAGGLVKPGMLVPSNGAPQANVSGRAAGGQKSGSIKATGKLKPSVTTGSVGSIAAQQPVKKAWSARKAAADVGDLARKPLVAFGAGASAERVNRKIKDRKVKKDDPSGTLRVRTHGPTHRHFDPESRRQRRLGQAQASTGIAGGGLIAAGVKSTKSFNERHKVVPLATHADAAAAHHVAGSLAVRSKPAAAVVGGAALLAGSNKIRRYANDPRNREWS